MSEVKVNVLPKGDVVTVLQGKTLDPKAPEKVGVAGLVTAPYAFLEKRLPNMEAYNEEDNLVNELNSHLIVDESGGLLMLVVNEKNCYGDEIMGKLYMDPDFEAFEINTGVSRDTFELAAFIKMNRSFFDSKNTAMALVSKLKNFKAKVKTEMEKADDDRGNTRLLHDQVLESNIPEAFDLYLPIFKGQKPVKIQVEINIDSRDFSCTLISPDAKDVVAETKKVLLQEQVDLIHNIAPELVIMHV